MNLKDKNILILEDELLIGRYIKESLEVMGANVSGVFDSAEEALESLTGQMPDAALIDIVLSGEMTGLEAGEILYKKFNIPVIFVTAYSDEYTIRNAKKSEPFGYLLKPIDQKELYITIEMTLYKHRLKENLKESKLWLETTLNCIADGVIALDKTGKISFMNTAAENITGWEMSEAVGSDLMEVFNIAEYEVDNSHNEKYLNDKVKSSYRTKQRIINKLTKEENYIESIDAPIISELGKMYGIVIVFRKLERKDNILIKNKLKPAKLEIN